MPSEPSALRHGKRPPLRPTRPDHLTCLHLTVMLPASCFLSSVPGRGEGRGGVSSLAFDLSILRPVAAVHLPSAREMCALELAKEAC